MHRALPSAVSGAVVMLNGFNLAPVVAESYRPQGQWIALGTFVTVIDYHLFRRLSLYGREW